MAIEEPPYRTLERQGDFELREYAPYMLAETRIARYDAPFMPWFLRRNEVHITAEATQ